MNILKSLETDGLMYRTRDGVRTVLGDRYDEKVGEARRFIEAERDLNGGSDLAAAQRLIRKIEKPFVHALIVAAYVEMKEAAS